VDYGKLDPGLQMALEHPQARGHRVLSVFVQTNGAPGPDAVALLERIGVRDIRPNRRVYTANVEAHVLDELSEQPWVRALTLSSPLRPLT
jgi:hypothetical protein